MSEDANCIRTPPVIMARMRSITLHLLRANGVRNVSLVLYTNAVSFEQLLTLGMP